MRASVARSLALPLSCEKAETRDGGVVRLRPNSGDVTRAVARVLFLSLACFASAAPAALPAEDDLRLIPRPRTSDVMPHCVVEAARIFAPVAARASRDAGAELLRDRWLALGIRRAAAPARLTVGVGSADGPRGAEAYRLAVTPGGVRIDAADAEGAFDAFATLAQLPRRSGRDWTLPCVAIDDAPALRWRILSDDVSRGPLPTMRYFEERIRTIASFKMNGYSPYMEHVFVDPQHPLPAPLDGITPDQLHELAVYAARYHVALIPEQQTFAHMHETLKLERYAPLAELPHGYLLAPANPGGEAYVRDLIADELATVPHPPFFHIGSDEPSDLGRGASAALVARDGEGAVYARHVAATADYIIAQGGGRPLIWDDAISKHPELFAALPKSLVFVNWHYGREATYEPYIDRIANAGFEQLVAPGALNWNEIYPDLDGALGNIDRFVTQGKAAHVLGLFQTVWHDDGETLFEASWYPVVYAAASAWEADSVDRTRFARDFPSAFFGSDDARYGSDLADLATCRTLIAGNPREYGDYLFWADAFEPDLAHVGTTVDLSALRLAAEDAEAHLRLAPPPPLHANAATVLFLAARRYDALGREYQIAREARAYYDDARANVGVRDAFVYRGLNVAKYLFWEQRDAMLALEPLVRAAWEYEDRPSHEESVLERYRVAADLAIARADRIQDVTYSDYVAKKTLPSFDRVLGLKPL
jgi:hexosaminidase